jgi:hypothetical protein
VKPKKRYCVEIETENATFWNTMDILLKFKGDNLTGFSNMFRLNICLLTLHINSDPFFKKRDLNISDFKFKKSLDKKMIISQKKKIEINSIRDKRFTNLNEIIESNQEDREQTYFLKWGLEELDHPISSLPNDFELEFEFEAESKVSKIGEIWKMEFQKIEKLRKDVLALLSKDGKDAYLGKTMLFGDVKLMDINGFVEREISK